MKQQTLGFVRPTPRCIHRGLICAVTTPGVKGGRYYEPMTTTAQRKKHVQWLCDLTAIPTAAGKEDRVIAWVRAWAKKRTNLKLSADKAGNLIIRPKAKPKNRGVRPVYITAHLDHPAFVVRKMLGGQRIELEFRGGVNDPYFKDAKLNIYDANDIAHRAVITKLDSKARPFKRITAKLSKKTDALMPGDVGRWAFTGRGAKPTIVKGILHAPACDDLAAVAAALSTLDILRARKGMEHVRVLLTRAEEVGFIGAIAACKNRSVPKSSRLICLENSRSYPESPIGAGPIVRVGDRISVFDPRLTNRISLIMGEYAKRNPRYKWQRKLMPGGACEATTFSTYGYESTCLCLPLGNYHNMRDVDSVLAGKRPARVGPEYISVDDYHGLIEMLIISITQLDDGKVPDILKLMEDLFNERGHVVRE